MSKSHTAGPWAAVDSGFDGLIVLGKCKSMVFQDGHIFEIDEQEDRLVAEIYGASVDEINANARLIAAAPEMFEALKAVKEHVDLHEYTYPCDISSLVNNAIAKAEGK